MGNAARIGPGEFQLMRDYVERECGLTVADDKAYLFETRLTPMMAERGLVSFADLHRAALNDTTHAIRDAIVDAVTTAETFWFRDEYPFGVLSEVVLEGRRGGAASAPLRVWSAACATGQEPYSIAMTLLESGPGCVTGASILATDISIGSLYLARAARYDQFAMGRGLAAQRRERYFTRSGKVWCLNKDVRGMVAFVRHNLQDPYTDLGTFDVVFCRNVLMYFSTEFRRDVLERIRALLRPGGVLILGAAESLLQYSDDYDLVHHGKGVYYRVRGDVGR